jgi:hypothetical protein
MPLVFTSVAAPLHPEEDEMAKERKPEEMTEEEIEQASGEPLPDREAMSVIRAVEPLPLPVFPNDPGQGIYTTDPPEPDDV